MFNKMMTTKEPKNKKLLLHESKRHTAYPVASTYCAALSPRGVGCYLPWRGGVPTLAGEGGVPTLYGVPNLARGYLPWLMGVPTLDGGVLTLARRGYLP